MNDVIAHIIGPYEAAPVAWSTFGLVALIALYSAGLFLANHRVKNDGIDFRHLRRSARRAVLLLGLAALTTTAAPAPAGGFQAAVPVGLPDLQSLPPIIWYDRNVELDDGTITRVLSFDGYLYNDGPGVLDLIGNPQEPDGVKQRYFDGEQWIDVATPWVQYETSDDHNHFHLMTASEYELWDEARTHKVDDSSKVGFCLLDTERVDDRYDYLYGIEEKDYCEQFKPDSEFLHMGITPGWVDTYDAATTLQWVDVSDTQPGRYWIVALTDPDDQVVEADETNNGRVFSQNRFPVSGYVARSLVVEATDDPVRLRANVYGNVAEPRWRIVEPPDHGHLSVPTGFDFVDDEVRYVPDPGFTGTDSFSYTVRDSSRAFPHNPTIATVEIRVDAPGGSDAADRDRADEDRDRADEDRDRADEDRDRADEAGPYSVVEAQANAADAITGIEILTTVNTREPAQSELALAADVADVAAVGEIAEWFTRDLPAGAHLNHDGSLRINATTPGNGVASVAYRLVGSSDLVAFEVPWVVHESRVDDRAPVDEIGFLSSARGEHIRLVLGFGTSGATYDAFGLPPGVELVSNTPILTGTPTASGRFEVELTETPEQGEPSSQRFVWQIRPGHFPEFPL